MKYLVMECHEAYAILMDEESRFFHAANLHYTVGQTVTSPILMQNETAAEEEPEVRGASSRIRRIVMRVSAAAACLLLAAGAGYFHYAQHYKPESVIVLNTDADIKMYLNKEGKVVKLKSDNEAGDALLESYDGLRKSKVTVAHELLAMQIANGSISDGDTVDLYISAHTSDDYDAYKSEFESDIKKLKLHVNVQDLTAHPEITAVTEPALKPVPDPAAEKPKKPEKPEKPEKPVKPAVEPGQTPPAKPEDPKKPEGREKTETIQPPKPEDPLKPAAEPPAAPAEKPLTPEQENPDAPKPAAPEKDPKAEGELKPDKPEPDPEHAKPEDPKHADAPKPDDDPLHAEKPAAELKKSAAEPKKPDPPVLPQAPEPHAAEGVGNLSKESPLNET